MSGNLLHAWNYFGAEIWEPLAEFSLKGELAPPDLFSDLFAAADDFLSPRPSYEDLEDARNNPEGAKQRFLALKGTDFSSEFAIVHFLEEVHDVLAEYEISGFVDSYHRLLREALSKFNLRYRLDDPFTLRFMLPGSFSNLYEELKRANASNGYLADLISDFEKSFDRYVRTQDPTDLKTCIAKASNYADGLASTTHGYSGTLGSVSKKLTDWPHDNLREALEKLYHFCSDYPGIRHGGTPSNAKRPLAARDVTLASLLFLSFSGYLTSGVDELAVLGI